MSGKQDKRARALAFREAKRRGLWKQGEAQVYNRWWRRLLRWLFPNYSARWAAVIGRWYKAQVKRWTKAARAYVHDREAQAFERTRAKIERQRRRDHDAIRRSYGELVEASRKQAEAGDPDAYAKSL